MLMVLGLIHEIYLKVFTNIPKISNHPELFYKIVTLKNFVNFTRKHLCCSLFLIKVHTQVYHFIGKRLQHKCFLVNFARFLKTSFLRAAAVAASLSIFYSKCSFFDPPENIKPSFSGVSEGNFGNKRIKAYFLLFAS